MRNYQLRRLRSLTSDSLYFDADIGYWSYNWH